MTHFGIICPPFSGHLNAIAALGRELKARGHQVTCLQVPDLALKVYAEGLEFCAIGQSTWRSGLLAETLQKISTLSGIPSLEYSLEFCRYITEIICEDAPAAIEATGIEVLLVDQLEPAGETVAAYLNLPFICVSCAQAIHRRLEMPPFFTHWLYRNAGWARWRNYVAYAGLDRSCQPMIQTLNHYRSRWGLDPYQQMYASAATIAHISQQPSEFDFPCPNLPTHFHYTGPFRDQLGQTAEFPFDQLTGKPLIYASLGSVQNTKSKLFQCIAAACVGLDVQLVITHGGGMSEEQAKLLPGSPLVVPYAPQLEVISRASLTITHGGLNTVLDSLSQGVPLVAIPITYEQPGTGARILWTGTGQVVPLKRLTVSRLRNAIEQVLSTDEYYQNAIRLKRSIQTAGGVKRAADIVESRSLAHLNRCLPSVGFQPQVNALFSRE